MTEQQRTARIEFAKKLLVANGFVEHTGFSLAVITYYKGEQLGIGCCVKIWKEEIEFYSRVLGYSVSPQSIPHDQSLKPLREFIKLSNQPPNEQTS